MYEDNDFNSEEAQRLRRKPDKVKKSFQRDRDGHGGKKGAEYIRSREKENLREILDELEEEPEEESEDEESEDLE